MSLYGSKVKIDGLSCGLVMRGSANGVYQVVFEREYASLEQIEAVNWTQPSIEGNCILPAGYGFTVVDIQYSNATRSYTVILEVAEQYLGDVAGFQAQVEDLQQTVSSLEGTLADRDATLQAKDQQLTAKDEALAEKDAAIAAMEAAGTAAHVDEQLRTAYEEGVESNG